MSDLQSARERDAATLMAAADIVLIRAKRPRSIVTQVLVKTLRALADDLRLRK